MEPFATAEDYETRYGQVDDTARLSALLEDASALLAAEWRRKYGSDYKEGVNSSLSPGFLPCGGPCPCSWTEMGAGQLGPPPTYLTPSLGFCPGN